MKPSDIPATAKLLFFVIPLLLVASCRGNAVTSTVNPPATSTPFQDGSKTTASLNATRATANPPESDESVPRRTPTRRPTLIPTPTPSTTPYPTFVFADQVTNTPQSPAHCPETRTAGLPEIAVNIEDMDPRALDDAISSALQAGYSMANVAAAVNRDYAKIASLIDLTGDSVPELVWRDSFALYAISCGVSGYFVSLEYPTNGAMSAPSLYSVTDMNRNGTPDLVIYDGPLDTGGETFVDILEWDGSGFQSLLLDNHGPDAYRTSRVAAALDWYVPDEAFRQEAMNSRVDVQLSDIDHNGTLELVLTEAAAASLPREIEFGPWRIQKKIYTWDGLHFILSELDLSPPKFRFQALQDADRAFLQGDYDEAARIYQDVIFSDKLEWWTPGLQEYLAYGGGSPALPSVLPPPEDPTEYSALASYSRYRLMLDYAARGSYPEAQTALEGLKAMGSRDAAAMPYVLVGEKFLAEFGTAHDMAQSCRKVVEYFRANQQLLAPLGDKTHGLQSHVYMPEDTCPF